MFDRRDVWVGLKPTARLRTSRGRRCRARRKSNKTTLRSAWRSALKKNLTEPTLLEMSGNPTTQELACAEPLMTGNQWFAVNKWQFYGKNRPKSKASLRRLQPAQELWLPFRRPRRRRRQEEHSFRAPS